uniref:C2H2-type domain-containing protein n=1 Tax=Opuntia streptacantha TaxID=393608 RepID=A0A7C9AL95_OPUST
MAGKELGFLKPSAPNLKEQLARKTLRNVRLQGHTYVDLREDGKRYIFFCTLCLAPCYSDAVLFDHLRGNLHKERLSAAKVTLMGHNPWPFDDGVLFFCNSDKEEKDVASGGNGKINLLDDRECVGDLAIVVHSKVSNDSVNGLTNGNGNPSSDILAGDCSSDDQDLVNGAGADYLVIPGVIGKEEVSDLRVRIMGYGQVSARFSEKDGIRNGMQRIWCEWLGKKAVGDDDKMLAKTPSLDFAIVTFGYYYDLGKQGLFDDVKMLLLTGREDSGTGDGSGKRRKRSFSDTENGSEVLSYQCDSSGEDSQGSSTATSSALVLHRIDDQLLQSRIISSKSLRRELRRQQRVASEKMCDICQHKMLPGKDVATLLNMKTGRLACSSRNIHGVSLAPSL